MPFYNLHTLLIERRVEERLNRTNVDGKTLKLVVNAQEFLHLVCKQHPEYALQLAVGEYCILHELIVDAVLTLLDCDASLCFVFPSVSLGDSAPESVFSDIDNAIAQTEYRNLILACQNGYSKKSLPPPILGLEQLQDSLRSITATVGPERLSIHVNESCPHVIQCVVKLAQSNSNAAEVCYILTDDRYVHIIKCVSWYSFS